VPRRRGGGTACAGEGALRGAARAGGRAARSGRHAGAGGARAVGAGGACAVGSERGAHEQSQTRLIWCCERMANFVVLESMFRV